MDTYPSKAEERMEFLLKLEYFSIIVKDRNKIVQLEVNGPELLDQTTYLFP